MILALPPSLRSGRRAFVPRPSPIVLRHQAPGGIPPPRLLQYFTQVVHRYTLEVHQDGRIASVMVGDEEGFGVRLHPEVALVVAALDDERHAVLPQSCQKLAPDTEAGRTVGQAFFDAG